VPLQEDLDFLICKIRSSELRLAEDSGIFRNQVSRQAIGQNEETPLRALNPDTDSTYVLITEEVYARLRGLYGEEKFVHDMYLSAMEIFGKEGWDDSAMDIWY
jgi:hypothetical protein